MPFLGCRRFFGTTTSWVNYCVVAFSTGGFALRVAGPLRRSPATTFYSCRPSGRCTRVCFRPLAIRRSLVPDDPSLLRRRLRTHQELASGRPDQSSTRRCRRFISVSLNFLLRPCAKLVRLGKQSRLCRRATDEEYPGRRRTKGARRRGLPSPAPFLTGPPAPFLRSAGPLPVRPRIASPWAS